MRRLGWLVAGIVGLSATVEVAHARASDGAARLLVRAHVSGHATTAIRARAARVDAAAMRAAGPLTDATAVRRMPRDVTDPWMPGPVAVLPPPAVALALDVTDPWDGHRIDLASGGKLAVDETDPWTDGPAATGDVAPPAVHAAKAPSSDDFDFVPPVRTN